MLDKTNYRGKTVIAAGTGISLALGGVFYAWGAFNGKIKRSIETAAPEPLTGPLIF